MPPRGNGRDWPSVCHACRGKGAFSGHALASRLRLHPSDIARIHRCVAGATIGCRFLGRLSNSGLLEP